MPQTKIKYADNVNSVSKLYKNQTVADSYIDKRFVFSWQRILHNKQVSTINNAIMEFTPDNILEVAPGPARLTTEITGVKKGTLLEYSEEMLTVAQKRLKEKNLQGVWDVKHGNAFELDKLNEHFDFIYTFRFIRHFHLEDRGRLYNGLSERLSSNGLLMFDVVNKPTRDKLDKKVKQPSKDSLPVYDVTYTEFEFRNEMGKFGFEVISLTPVLPLFAIQNLISCKLDDVVPKLSNTIVHLLEAIPNSNPLEWIALVKKK